MNSQVLLLLQQLSDKPSVFKYETGARKILRAASTKPSLIKGYDALALQGLVFRRDEEVDGLRVITYGVTAAGRAACGTLPGPRAVVHRAPPPEKQRRSMK